MITRATTSHPRPIEVDIDTWVIMREHPTEPRAIVHRILDTTSRVAHRYLLFQWKSYPHDRPLLGVYATLPAADAAVPWHPTSVVSAAPPMPGASAEAEHAWNERVQAEWEEGRRASAGDEG